MSLITLFIVIIVAVALCYGIWYLIGLLPPPTQKPARIIFVVFLIIVLLYILISVVGGVGLEHVRV
jgi:hypothetical protein